MQRWDVGMAEWDDVDVHYMKSCLELARRAGDLGETAIGSLIVRDGDILGEGIESTRKSLDPSAHAEMEAIRVACEAMGSTDLTGCSIYTTVEPCLLCGYAIRATSLTRVVFGSSAGEVGAMTSPHAFLGDDTFKSWGEPPRVTGGVLEVEAKALLERFRALR
jgi:tRNA(adenine34) deaminase